MRTRTSSTSWGRWVIAGVVGLLTVAPIGAAMAQPGPGGRGPCDRPERLLTPEDRQLIGDRIMQRIQEKVGLTQEQADEIRGVLSAQRDEARGERKQLCEARVELRRLLASQDADPAAVKAVSEKVKSLQAGLLDRRVDTYLTLRSKLTPEQWQKWIELRQHKGRRFRGHGPRV